MNKKRIYLAMLLPGLALLGVASSGSLGRCELNPPAQASSAPRVQLVAGPGRVEPESEDIKLGPELSGKLRKVHVEEGASIRQGQILAELENDEYAAAVRSAEAEVRAKEAALRKLLKGARGMERSSLAAVHEAHAVMQDARSEFERRRALFAHNAISSQELEVHARAQRVTEAKYEQAKLHHALLAGPAREDEQAIAEAELDLARSRLDEARARYEKTFIRSPIDGNVLRKHHRSGESVSSGAMPLDPVLTVGNTQLLRVRAEIDERDIGRVRLGQKAYVSADAFKPQRFWGAIVRVGEQLGRKNIRTEEPTQRVDSKILEVLIELQPGTKLPVGLRVDAFVVTTPSGETDLARP